MLKSERLTLCEITLEDAAFIQKLVNTSGWLKFIGDRNVTNVQEAKTFIKNWALDRYEKLGYGPLLVLLHNEPIGVCGLFKRDHLDHPDLGFAILPAHSGKGYTFVASQLVIDYARSFGHPKLYAITLKQNIPSQNLLLKLGFDESENLQESEDLLFELNLT